MVFENDLASIFLKEFVKSILVALHPELTNMQMETEPVKEKPKQKNLPMVKMARRLPALRPMKFNQVLTPAQEAAYYSLRKMRVPIPSYKMQQYFARNKEWPTIAVKTLNVEKPKVVIQQAGKLESLIYLLSDPNVISLECQGPGQQVLLNKAGQIQNSNVILSEEEIKEIMAEISRRTGQSFDSGFARVIMGNFAISAVISEFVGTRFVMQKLQHSPGGV